MRSKHLKQFSVTVYICGVRCMDMEISENWAEIKILNGKSVSNIT
jgi:hypothetical protein